MILAVQIFQIIFYSIAIVFMCALTFIGIWSFITFNRMYNNQRIQNFLLDKIYQSISQLSLNFTYQSKTTEDEFDVDELINEDKFFNNNNSCHNNEDNTISF